MITPYGIGIVRKFFMVTAAIVFCAFAFFGNGIFRYATLGLVGVATVFVLNFFRDPTRTPPTAQNVVVSPADGKVVLIKHLTERDYLNREAVQVSIFMSPLNVHVNRIPISGTIGYFEYIPGEYLVAFDEKSSERNERTLIGVENSNGYKILMKQIAGIVARRIVSEVQCGQRVTIGERFGMIKFGSRVDVIMPKESELKVHLHDRVVAGESILAIHSSITT